MRVKYRYVLFKVLYDVGEPHDTTLTTPQVAKAIQLSTEQQFGDWGAAAQRNGFTIKYFQPLTGLGIAKFPRDTLRTMIFAMVQIKKLNQKVCRLDILEVSGTIRKCQQTAVELSREMLRGLAQVAFAQEMQQEARKHNQQQQQQQQQNKNNNHNNKNNNNTNAMNDDDNDNNTIATTTNTTMATPIPLTTTPLTLTNHGDILPGGVSVVEQLKVIEDEINAIDNAAGPMI